MHCNAKTSKVGRDYIIQNKFDFIEQKQQHVAFGPGNAQYMFISQVLLQHGMCSIAVWPAAATAALLVAALLAI